MARIAGALSLLSLLSAIFGEFIVRRLELAGDVIALLAMAAVTVLLYVIFKPVSQSISLLAASVNLMGIACGAFHWNPRGIDIPVVLNGVWSLLIGYLVFNSIFLPRILGVLIAFAGLGWLTYLSPHFAGHLSPYNLAAGVLGQESLMLWLLVKGVNDQRWKQQAGAACITPSC